MDAHLIYTVSHRLGYYATWGEWIYFGDGETIKEDVVLKNINKCLFSDILYVASTRTESIETTKQEVMKVIEPL